MHVSRYLWKLLSDGAIEPAFLRFLTLYHGLDCRGCADEFRAFEAGELPASTWPRGSDWTPPRDVERQLEELDALSAEEGAGKIGRARTRFRGFDFLVAAVKRVRTLKQEGDLPEARRWAAFLRAAGEETHERRAWPLTLLAQAETADVHRRLGEYEEAWRIFNYSGIVEQFTGLLRKGEERPRDPYVDAVVTLYRGQLLDETGYAFEAVRHLSVAGLLLALAGDVPEKIKEHPSLQAMVEETRFGDDRRLPRLYADISPGDR